MNGCACEPVPTDCSTTVHSLRSLPLGNSGDSQSETGWLQDVKTIKNALKLFNDIGETKKSKEEECFRLESDSHDSKMDVDEEDVGDKTKIARSHESYKRKLKVVRSSSTKLTSGQKTPRRKKRRRRRRILICTTNCKYDVVRQIAARFGMKEVGEEEPWNLYWTDLSVSVERAKEMKRFQ
ncbi:Tubulin polyglutamylase TTLL13, partial [Gryllus bimaculatus]